MTQAAGPLAPLWESQMTVLTSAKQSSPDGPQVAQLWEGKRHHEMAGEGLDSEISKANRSQSHMSNGLCAVLEIQELTMRQQSARNENYNLELKRREAMAHI